MANVKISQLPTFTGNTQDAWLVMNDSGETTSYKVQKKYLNASAGFSWTNGSPAYFNIAEAADQYLPFNTTIFNTNTDIFELVNAGSTSGTNGDTGARVFFKQPGIYEIICQIHFFDLRSNIDFRVKVSSASTSAGTMSVLTLLHDARFSETSTDQLLNGTLLLNVTTPTYYTICVNATDVDGNPGPYPSDGESTPPRIFVKKIS